MGGLASVVIPAYNEERYLGDAVRSVLDQTYRPIEVIVVDDGSTDGTAGVAEGIAEVRLLRQPNRGLGAARNAGAAAAGGEYIAFHDADDLMTPDKLAKQIGHLERHPACGCVLARQRLLLEEGAPLPFWVRETPFPHGPEVPAGGGGEEPHTMTMVMRRAALDEVGPFDERLRIAQDIDWYFRAQESGVGVEILDDVLLIRRVHPASLTQDAEGSRRELFMAFRNRMNRRRDAARRSTP
jgi:glycosyltransferase involved in cell wall biosynthesis